MSPHYRRVFCFFVANNSNRDRTANEPPKPRKNRARANQTRRDDATTRRRRRVNCAKLRACACVKRVCAWSDCVCARAQRRWSTESVNHGPAGSLPRQMMPEQLPLKVARAWRLAHAFRTRAMCVARSHATFQKKDSYYYVFILYLYIYIGRTTRRLAVAFLRAQHTTRHTWPLGIAHPLFTHDARATAGYTKTNTTPNDDGTLRAVLWYCPHF